MFIILSNLWHALTGGHTTETILGDFHRIVAKLEALHDRKRDHAETHEVVSAQLHDMAEEQAGHAEAAHAEADKALAAADKIRALVA